MKIYGVMLRVFLNYSEIFTQIINKNRNICDGVRKEEENNIEDSQKIERFQWHTIYSSGLLHHSSYKTQCSISLLLFPNL